PGDVWRHAVIDRALGQIDRSGTAHWHFGRGQLQIIVLEDAVGDRIGAGERAEIGIVIAADGTRQRRRGVLHGGDDVDSLNVAVLEIEAALAAEIADDLALTLATSRHIDDDAAGAAELVEIGRVFRQSLDRDAGEIEIHCNRWNGATAVGGELAL